MKADGFVVDAVCSGQHRSFTASQVVFALGGYQERQSSLQARIAGTLRLADGWASKTMISSELMTLKGQRTLAGRLTAPKPRLVVLGSSHSAITSAWLARPRTGARAGLAQVEDDAIEQTKVGLDLTRRGTDPDDLQSGMSCLEAFLRIAAASARPPRKYTLRPRRPHSDNKGPNQSLPEIFAGRGVLSRCEAQTRGMPSTRRKDARE